MDQELNQRNQSFPNPSYPTTNVSRVRSRVQLACFRAETDTWPVCASCAGPSMDPFERACKEFEEYKQRKEILTDPKIKYMTLAYLEGLFRKVTTPEATKSLLHHSTPDPPAAARARTFSLTHPHHHAQRSAHDTLTARRTWPLTRARANTPPAHDCHHTKERARAAPTHSHRARTRYVPRASLHTHIARAYVTFDARLQSPNRPLCS